VGPPPGAMNTVAAQELAPSRSRTPWSVGSRRPRYEVWTEPLPGGARTSVHLARYPLETTRARVVALDPARTLLRWCGDNGHGDAIVGGFFVRSGGAPLGELWLGGRRIESVPFDERWRQERSCVWISGRSMRLAPLGELPSPPGDLLQAGPLLVREGEPVVRDGQDPEGFSGGAHQFDSDITVGRYPRAALGLTDTHLLALVCDGRTRDDAGMSLVELAAVLIRLGARRAINLDGGGSASLVFKGRLRNHPREEHGISIVGGRPLATAISFEVG
jgi:hypothetical protein